MPNASDVLIFIMDSVPHAKVSTATYYWAIRVAYDDTLVNTSRFVFVLFWNCLVVSATDRVYVNE